MGSVLTVVLLVITGLLRPAPAPFRQVHPSHSEQTLVIGALWHPPVPWTFLLLAFLLPLVRLIQLQHRPLSALTDRVRRIPRAPCLGRTEPIKPPVEKEKSSVLI